jgi:membrane dipeptidase
VARTYGADHVTIGTDTAYTSSRSPAERGKVPARPKGRSRWAYFWPPGALGNGASGSLGPQSLAWTNWPMFTVGLVQRGYTDEDIRKILGGNMLRVAKAVYPDGGPAWA